MRRGGRHQDTPLRAIIPDIVKFQLLSHPARPARVKIDSLSGQV